MYNRNEFNSLVGMRDEVSLALSATSQLLTNKIIEKSSNQSYSRFDIASDINDLVVIEKGISLLKTYKRHQNNYFKDHTSAIMEAMLSAINQHYSVRKDRPRILNAGVVYISVYSSGKR